MSEYWKQRFEMLEDARNKTAMGTVQSVTPAFDRAQAQIEKEINAWYGRFAKNNQISLLEAKKLLNSKELKEFHWDVQEYIKWGGQNAIDQKWMKELENASARFHISRLEALKIRTQNAAERAFGNELDALDEMAARIYMDDYYHTAYEIQKGLGIGFDVSQIDERKLNSILSKPWTADKMTFSDRIWKSKAQLIDSVHTELTQMCVLGKTPDEAIKNIQKRMNVSKGQAGRLVMTEAAYFGSVAQKDCFNDLDVEKYEIVATLDNRTSDVCQQMDGKVFNMNDFQAGVTAPPFHVWCRSCTVPWFEDNNDGTRTARGADGKTYQVPANMKYSDWMEYFVDKTKDPADWLKVATVEDVVEAVKKFVPAKTVAEAEEYARQFADTVDFGKLSIKACNSINETLEVLTAKYGVRLPKIGTYSKGDGVAHASYRGFEAKAGYFNKPKSMLTDYASIVKENEKKIEDLKERIKSGVGGKQFTSKLEQQLKVLENKNKHSRWGVCDSHPEEAVKAVTTHEFGHFLADVFCGQINGEKAWKDSAKLSYSRIAQPKQQLIRKAFDEAVASGDIYKISAYSITNPFEFFAETFTMMEFNEPLPDYITDMLKEVLS